MFFRFTCLLALTFVMAGCANNPTSIAAADSDSALDKLRGENKGLLLIHSSLHDGACFSLLATVARPDAEGRYVGGEEIYLKRITNRPNEPTEVVLPAGDYGIVQLDCWNSPHHRYFNARLATHGIILTSAQRVYEQPIAKFSLQPGEFVDVGSLQLTTSHGGFQTYVLPIDEGQIQQLASAKPALYAHRVRRLMTTPGQPPQSNPPAATAAPRQPRQAPNGPIVTPNG